jgi:amino-acid N-acetyltransferase
MLRKLKINMEMEIKSTLIQDAERFDEFRNLLKSAGLPHNDLSLDRHILIGYYDDQKLIGTGALELCGPYALLRSLAVNDALRGRSLGSRIADELIAVAEKHQIKSIYLLTESARLFFKRKGFTDINRESVPDEIKESSEFSGVCGDNAVCMERTISNP